MKKLFYAGLMAGLVPLSIAAILRFTLNIGTIAEALTDAIVRHLPLNLFTLAVNNLGSRAKISLTIVLALVILVVAGLVSMLHYLAWRKWAILRKGPKWAWASGLGVLLWFLTCALVLPASDKGFFGLSLPAFPLATLMVWLAALIFYSILQTLLWPQRESAFLPRESRGISRRSFLKIAGYAGAGVLAAGALGLTVWKSLLSAAGSIVEVGKMPKDITPNDEFYAVSKDFSDPQIDLANWKLEVSGLIEPALSLSYEQLKALPSSTFYWTLECIGNEIGGDLIGNAQWKGVRLADLFASGNIAKSATRVVFYGADDYSDSVSLNQALSEAFLAYEMNGVALPGKHGSPVRLLVADLYGMKNVKWLAKIELVDHDFQGFWESAGWSQEAVVQTMSRIDIPGPVTHVKVGESVLLGGVAYAGSRGIAKVEVSADGGSSWQAVNGTEDSRVSWALWFYSWTPTAAGEHIIKVRATDGQGQLQSDRRTYTLPDGATGLDSVMIIVDPRL